MDAPQLKDDSGNRAVLWAEAAVHTLRARRAAASLDSAQDRKEQLESEIRNLLVHIPIGERQASLQLMRSLLAPERKDSGLPEIQDRLPSNSVSPDPTLEIWMADFSKIQAELRPDDIRQLLIRLREKGHLPSDPEPLKALFIECGWKWPETPESGGNESIGLIVTKALGLPANVVLQSEREARIFSMLLNRFMNIDRKFWSFWKLLAEQAKVDLVGRSPVQEKIRAYALGDTEVPAVILDKRLEETERHIAAILAAVVEAWKSANREMDERFSPSALEEKIPQRGLFDPTVSARRWSAYRESYQDLNEEVRFVKFLASFVQRTEALAAKGAANPPHHAAT